MKPDLRIVLAQINPTVGDFTGNAGTIRAFFDRAQELQPDIIVFPELALCGYPPEDLLLKKHFVRDNLNEVKKISRMVKTETLIVGFVDSDQSGRLFNAAAVIQERSVCGVYHKERLPNYGVFDEARYFSPGTTNGGFTVGPWRIGLSICEDIWEENGSYIRQVAQGATVLINISASPFCSQKLRMRTRMLKQRARTTGCHVCYLNMVGGQDELIFDGGSLVVDPQGTVVTSGRQFEEDLVSVDIPAPPLCKKRQRQTSFFIPLSYTARDKRDGLPVFKRTTLPVEEEIYKALVLGTRDYTVKNGFNKAVIGLSGGIDSALTAAIAVDALGRENVIGVSMPSQFSSHATQADARRVAERLGIRFMTIPIRALYTQYLAILSDHFNKLPSDETEENVQARIRGTLLMALSNKFGWLVLTTGNKSETAVGYCTLYGDMAGGFAVIKDVSKTWVYRLTQFINAHQGRPVIPPSIIRRPPSAELRAGQKDQDSLPPYDILDKILEAYIENDKSRDEIIAKIRQPHVVKDVLRKIDRNEYKRRQAPPGIKITSKSFGKDRRLPITNRYREA